MLFKITFKNGLQNPTVVDAPNAAEAAKLGLAHHRKNSGFVETVDFWPIDRVVNTVEPIDE